MHIQIAVTSLRGFSSMSKKSSINIKKTLRKYFSNVDIAVINNESDLRNLVRLKPDVVFCGFKFLPASISSRATNQPIWLAEYLLQHDIATTGSSAQAHALDQDKAGAKKIVMNNGLQTSPHFTAKVGQFSSAQMLPLDFPLFLKPPNRGAGVGVDDKSVVRNFSEFTNKVEALQSQQKSIAIVEKYLDGREFTVAVLKNQDNVLEAMPIEQLPEVNKRGDRIIGYEMKSGAKETAVSVVEPGELRETVKKLALDVFGVLGARDYGRIDIRLDNFGVPHFLEVNLIPGLIDGSGNFQKATQMNKGMTYDQMLLRIVELAANRFENADYIRQNIQVDILPQFAV